jgi:hypothetical protein
VCPFPDLVEGRNQEIGNKGEVKTNAVKTKKSDKNAVIYRV